VPSEQCEGAERGRHEKCRAEDDPQRSKGRRRQCEQQQPGPEPNESLRRERQALHALPPPTRRRLCAGFLRAPGNGLERRDLRPRCRDDGDAVARPAAQGPNGDERGTGEGSGGVAEQIGLRVPEPLDEVPAEDVELVLEPLDVLVEATYRHANGERDDEDARDPRDPALPNRDARIGHDP
jgi:hypothetical protein